MLKKLEYEIKKLTLMKNKKLVEIQDNIDGLVFYKFLQERPRWIPKGEALKDPDLRNEAMIVIYSLRSISEYIKINEASRIAGRAAYKFWCKQGYRKKKKGGWEKRKY